LQLSIAAYSVESLVLIDSQKLGFINRNLKGTPRELKRLTYVAFVRSGMEGYD